MSESGCRFQEPETPNPNYQGVFEVLYAISIQTNSQALQWLIRY